jgi:hypothetical protein
LSDLSVTNDFGLIISGTLDAEVFSFGVVFWDKLFCLFLILFWALKFEAADPDLLTIAPDGFISMVLFLKLYVINFTIFFNHGHNYELFFSASATLVTFSLVA